MSDDEAVRTASDKDVAPQNWWTVAWGRLVSLYKKIGPNNSIAIISTVLSVVSAGISIYYQDKSDNHAREAHDQAVLANSYAGRADAHASEANGYASEANGYAKEANGLQASALAQRGVRLKILESGVLFDFGDDRPSKPVYREYLATGEPLVVSRDDIDEILRNKRGDIYLYARVGNDGATDATIAKAGFLIEDDRHIALGGDDLYCSSSTPEKYTNDECKKPLRAGRETRVTVRITQIVGQIGSVSFNKGLSMCLIPEVFDPFCSMNPQITIEHPR